MNRIALILLILIPVSVWGQSFDAEVNFDLELSDLYEPRTVEATVQDGRVVILEGLMGDSLIVETEAGIEVWVTLVGGSWIGTDEVRSYACRILFRGEEWVDVFPGGQTQEESETYVPMGSRLLVAAHITGYDLDAQVATAEMVSYRVLN